MNVEKTFIFLEYLIGPINYRPQTGKQRPGGIKQKGTMFTGVS